MKTKHIITLLLLSVTAVLANSLDASSLPLRNYDYYRVSNGLSPAVAAIGGLNVTNASFTNTSYNNPSLLAFRKPSTVSASLRFYKEDEAELDDRNLPVRSSYLWNSKSLAYVGVEAENVAFSYLSLARINFDNPAETPAGNTNTYLDYYLDGYRFSYGSKSGLLAFGVNATFLNGRIVYLRNDADNDLIDRFIDDKAYGYGLDFGAVIKSGYFSYGLYIPNLISSLYWQNHYDASLNRRFNTGIQYGNDESFIVSGFSSKFDFKSKSTYHLGLQQNVSIGQVRGQYYTVPVRLGAYSDKPFRRLKELNYGFGTGFQYGYFMIDVSLTTESADWSRYFIMSSAAISFE